MTKKTFIALVIACSFGCTKKQTSVLNCPAQMCTMNFASVTVQFQDKNGNSVTVKNYSVLNQRTNERLTSSGTGINSAGHYTVVDDGMLKKLSTEGDEIVVTATHPTTNQIKTATYKISGGCNCHVERIAGPQVIVFD